VVREKGLEPLPRKPGLGPQPSASANSATRARGVRSEYRIAPAPCQAAFEFSPGIPTPCPLPTREGVPAKRHIANGRLTDRGGSPILSIAAGTPLERRADVAQWQSNGFVNRRLPVQVRPSAPERIDHWAGTRVAKWDWL
jgi:hypothetical protein